MEKKRVSLGIAPEDLHIGDFVAVVEPKQSKQPRLVMGRDSDGEPMLISHTPNNPSPTVGVPHKVLGLSWPWAVFGVLIPGGEVDGPIIHDLRNVKCMRLEKSYVDAIKAFEKPEQEDKQDELPI